MCMCFKTNGKPTYITVLIRSVLQRKQNARQPSLWPRSGKCSTIVSIQESLKWSKYDEYDQDKMLIKVLRHTCSTSTKFNSCICWMKKYFSTWIKGSNIHRLSNTTDYAASSQHKVAMLCLCTEQVKAANMPTAEGSLICKSLLVLEKNDRLFS